MRFAVPSGVASLSTAVVAIQGYEPVVKYFTDPSILDNHFLPALFGTLAAVLAGIIVQFSLKANLGEQKSAVRQ